jgi:hypothetical protein
MGIFFLTLESYTQNIQCGAVVGISIDGNTSSQDAAIATLASPVATTLPLPQVHSATMQPERATPIVFRAPPLPGASEPETVVITVKPAPVATGFDITLTERSQLMIKPRQTKTSLVILSPSLIRIAMAEVDQCIALLGNQKRCQLRKSGRDWCPVHREYHQFLHNEELKDRKHLHERVRQSLYMGSNNDSGTQVYNGIQASLALRIMITEILYAGDEDDNHATFFSRTKQNRANLSQHLAWNKSDGSGRISISSFIGGFLNQARDRESRPESRSVWEEAVVVDLSDVSAMQAFQTQQDRFPSVFELFGAAGSSAMRDHLFKKAEQNGDLPDLPPRLLPAPFVAVKPLTEEEEREYWVEHVPQIDIDTANW